MQTSSPIVSEPSLPEPWYRHGWVWAVITIPFSAVLFGMVMIISANYQPDDLVVDDYYKAGKSINQEIGFDRQAAAIGVMASLDSVTDEGLIFRLSSDQGVLSPALKLSLFHVTNDEQDIAAEMVHQGGGIYSVHSLELVERLDTPGVWYLELRDQEQGWRLRARVVSPVAELTIEPRPVSSKPGAGESQS